MKILKKICKIENIYIKPEAEKFVLSICNNSVRILINYLEKFKLLSRDIDVELATAVCTNIAFQEFITYTNLCKDGNIRDATILMYKLFDKGYSVMDVLDNFFLFVKTTTLLTESEKYKVIPSICKYITIFHNVHEDEIELALFTNNLISIFSSSTI
jgi:DNA polymerase III gamma/tau subunit